MAERAVAPKYVPSVRMRRIARVLRQWRAASGLSLADVATKCDWSESRQSRLEAAQSRIKAADVMMLAVIYKIAEKERENVVNSVFTAQEKGWWETTGQDALASDLRDYVALEAEAKSVRSFKNDLVDGLLQTERYTNAVGSRHLPRTSPETRHDRAGARAQRQQRLVEDEPINLELVLTEGALRVEVDGMREQIERMIQLDALPNVSVRVIPASAGAYPAMGCPFYILGFDTGEPDVCYIELIEQGLLLEEVDVVKPYILAFDGLRDMALDRKKSIELMTEIGNTLK